MMVLPLPYDNMSSPKQTAESMISGLRDKGLTEVEYISSSDERINGYEAYELIAKGQMEGEEAYLLVQTIIKGANQTPGILPDCLMRFAIAAIPSGNWSVII